MQRCLIWTSWYRSQRIFQWVPVSNQQMSSLYVPLGGPGCTVHTTDLKFLLFILWDFCDPCTVYLILTVYFWDILKHKEFQLKLFLSRINSLSLFFISLNVFKIPSPTPGAVVWSPMFTDPSPSHQEVSIMQSFNHIFLHWLLAYY